VAQPVQVYEGNGEQPPPAFVFRSMRIDAQRRPVIGRSKRCLGVVVADDPANAPGALPDVHPQDGIVHPNGEGMSVALSSPWNLLDHRRPSGYWKGTGRDPIFELAEAAIPEALSLHPDSVTHAVIQPTASMPLERFEASLQETRPHWEEVVR
jgi:hypothetical protein